MVGRRSVFGREWVGKPASRSSPEEVFLFLRFEFPLARSILNKPFEALVFGGQNFRKQSVGSFSTTPNVFGGFNAFGR